MRAQGADWTTVKSVRVSWVLRSVVLVFLIAAAAYVAASFLVDVLD